MLSKVVDKRHFNVLLRTNREMLWYLLKICVVSGAVRNGRWREHVRGGGGRGGGGMYMIFQLLSS